MDELYPNNEKYKTSWLNQITSKKLDFCLTSVIKHGIFPERLTHQKNTITALLNQIEMPPSTRKALMRIIYNNLLRTYQIALEKILDAEKRSMGKKKELFNNAISPTLTEYTSMVNTIANENLQILTLNKAPLILKLITKMLHKVKSWLNKNKPKASLQPLTELTDKTVELTEHLNQSTEHQGLVKKVEVLMTSLQRLENKVNINDEQKSLLKKKLVEQKKLLTKILKKKKTVSETNPQKVRALRFDESEIRARITGIKSTLNNKLKLSNKEKEALNKKIEKFTAITKKLSNQLLQQKAPSLAKYKTGEILTLLHHETFNFLSAPLPKEELQKIETALMDSFKQTIASELIKNTPIPVILEKVNTTLKMIVEKLPKNYRPTISDSKLTLMIKELIKKNSLIPALEKTLLLSILKSEDTSKMEAIKQEALEKIPENYRPEISSDELKLLRENAKTKLNQTFKPTIKNLQDLIDTITKKHKNPWKKVKTLIGALVKTHKHQQKTAFQISKSQGIFLNSLSFQKFIDHRSNTKPHQIFWKHIETLLDTSKRPLEKKASLKYLETVLDKTNLDLLQEVLTTAHLVPTKGQLSTPLKKAIK
ncbi:MAG TPA: hypothetical protein QF353_04790 [Gammaproteobacteria bacterium]|nr:hypothetical protein [Gammaproteobacteria bacterium]